MDRLNVQDAAHAMNHFTRELHLRAERVLDHLHGPRPSNVEEKPPVHPGVIGTLEQVASNHIKLEHALSAIESALGVGSGMNTAQNAAPVGVGAIRGR